MVYVDPVKVELDPEFEAWGKTKYELDEIELAKLEAKLKAEGCQDPLKAWPHEGKHTLVDGYHRHAICTANGIPFTVVEVIPLRDKDRLEAKKWIVDNQLGRRNLTDQQRKYAIGERLELEKQDQHSHPKSEHQNDARFDGKTAAKIADKVGKSQATVERAEDFKKNIDKVAEGAPELAKNILNQKVKGTDAEVKRLAKKSLEEKKEVEEKVNAGEVTKLSDVLPKVEDKAEGKDQPEDDDPDTWGERLAAKIDALKPPEKIGGQGVIRNGWYWIKPCGEVGIGFEHKAEAKETFFQRCEVCKVLDDGTRCWVPPLVKGALEECGLIGNFDKLWEIHRHESDVPELRMYLI
ncbi:MAG: ParB N-terminal domain-containing protein [Methanotrichaceae archaeon]|jgi:hypothetical protein